MRDWIASQSPPVPTRLAERLSAALAAADYSGREAPESLVETAAGILQRTFADPNDERNRAAALDLLAADALITYAIESAADDCDSFVAQIDAMVKRLSSIAIDSTESK